MRSVLVVMLLCTSCASTATTQEKRAQSSAKAHIDEIAAWMQAFRGIHGIWPSDDSFAIDLPSHDFTPYSLAVRRPTEAGWHGIGPGESQIIDLPDTLVRGSGSDWIMIALVANLDADALPDVWTCDGTGAVKHDIDDLQ